MKLPGRTVHMSLEARWWKELDLQYTKNYLQQSTAKQCQQQDKEEGTSPTPESAYDTVCRLTLREV